MHVKTKWQTRADMADVVSPIPMYGPQVMDYRNWMTVFCTTLNPAHWTDGFKHIDSSTGTLNRLREGLADVYNDLDSVEEYRIFLARLRLIIIGEA